MPWRVTGVLVLTRKIGEGIAIGDDVTIIVMQIKGKQVRLGIKASPTTIVHREEIYRKIQEENRLAAKTAVSSLDGIKGLIETDKEAQKVPIKQQVRVTKKDDE